MKDVNTDDKIILKINRKTNLKLFLCLVKHNALEICEGIGI